MASLIILRHKFPWSQQHHPSTCADESFSLDYSLQFPPRHEVDKGTSMQVLTVDLTSAKCFIPSYLPFYRGPRSDLKPAHWVIMDILDKILDIIRSFWPILLPYLLTNSTYLFPCNFTNHPAQQVMSLITVSSDSRHGLTTYLLTTQNFNGVVAEKLASHV
eukprot:scaffold4021_cov115-Skeletonema_dohrnii-CCMP3373.AAC.7